jgi:hypothetical protein
MHHHGNELIVVIWETLGFSKFKIASIDSLCMVKEESTGKLHYLETCLVMYILYDLLESWFCIRHLHLQET